MSDEKWEVKRAQLERKKNDTMAIVQRHDNTPRPLRDITDSEYRAAKSRLMQISTQISEGDHEANKPVNPYDQMSKVELQAALDKLKTEVTAVDYEGQMVPAKDGRKIAQIMRIQTILQAMGDDN